VSAAGLSLGQMAGDLAAVLAQAQRFTLGVRPEYVTIAAAHEPGALPATVERVQDVGTYQLLTALVGEHRVRARLSTEAVLPTVGDPVWLGVLGPHTCFYRESEELLA
jgi:glycerol transport system ATP-binding protein